MRKKDVRQEYRRWKFWDKVPLITKDQQWKHYFDNKFDNIDIDVDVNVDTKPIEDVVESTIENMLETAFNSEMCKVHQHIEEAKDHLCCDICCARKDIKKHMDDIFEDINFEEKFSNLNEQAQTIINKLNNL